MKRISPRNLVLPLSTLGLVLVALTACGAHSTVSANAPEAETTPQPAVESGASREADSWAEIEGFEPEKTRILVASATTDQTGYVDREYVDPAVKRTELVVAPIYDSYEGGSEIAYWGTGLGWLDKETVEAADFDHEALIEQERREAIARLESELGPEYQPEE